MQTSAQSAAMMSFLRPVATDSPDELDVVPRVDLGAVQRDLVCQELLEILHRGACSPASTPTVERTIGRRYVLAVLITINTIIETKPPLSCPSPAAVKPSLIRRDEPRVGGSPDVLNRENEHSGRGNLRGTCSCHWVGDPSLQCDGAGQGSPPAS